jgi:hypothetical protein
MQERFAVVRATVIQYTLPVAIPKNTFIPYGDLEEKSDGLPPSPKKTDATETKIDKSLHKTLLRHCLFLNLFIMDFSFKGPMKLDIAFVLLQKVSLLGEESMRLMMSICCVGLNFIAGQSLLQHCDGKGNEYHTATAFILEHC